MEQKIVLKTYEPRKKFLEKNRNKLKIFCFILLFAGIIFLSSYLSINLYSLKEAGEKTIVRFVGFSTNEVLGEVINYDFFLEKLKTEEILDSIPNDRQILLKFYNFNSGRRKWEESFVLSNNKVIRGETEDYDILIFVHSKYVNEISIKSLCEVIPRAKLNNDLGIEIKISESELLLRYNSMMKYRSCLGI